MQKIGISIKMMRRLFMLAYPKYTIPKAYCIRRLLKATKRRNRRRIRLPPPETKHQNIFENTF